MPGGQGSREEGKLGRTDLWSVGMSIKVSLAVLLHIIVVVIMVWDMVALAMHRPDHTISSIVRDWSYSAPILPFAIGMVIGHLFW